MNPTLEIASPGALATIQDLGRIGYRRFGVPRAGALDPALLRIANALAGNREDAPGIEFFMGGLCLRAVGGPIRIAGAGDFAIEVSGGERRRLLPAWRSTILMDGEQARCGTLRRGRCGLVAVAGLELPAVLGSRSTYARAGLGGLNGRALLAGDRIALSTMADETAGDRSLPQPPTLADGEPVRIVCGPQSGHFTREALATLLSAEWEVTREADRMGIRLAGPSLRHRPGMAEIISDATVPGSIQVPGNGQPIVLLADGQTAGGYPKIATVISADLARLANRSPGQTLRFEAVDVESAEALCRQREDDLRKLIRGIVQLAPEGGIDLDALQGGNLVSGVVDARAPEPTPNPGAIP